MTSPTKEDSKNEGGVFKKLLNFILRKDDKETPKSEYSKINEADDTNMWVADEKVLMCYNCDKEFNSIFIRKHHCRVCGNIFCYDCCKKNIDETLGNLSHD